MAETHPGTLLIKLLATGVSLCGSVKFPGATAASTDKSQQAALSTSGGLVDQQNLEILDEQQVNGGWCCAFVAGEMYKNRSWHSEMPVRDTCRRDVLSGCCEIPHFVVALTYPHTRHVPRTVFNSPLQIRMTIDIRTGRNAAAKPFLAVQNRTGIGSEGMGKGCDLVCMIDEHG